jgi:hypothetical protein
MQERLPRTIRCNLTPTQRLFLGFVASHLEQDPKPDADAVYVRTSEFALDDKKQLVDIRTVLFAQTVSTTIGHPEVTRDVSITYKGPTGKNLKSIKLDVLKFAPKPTDKDRPFEVTRGSNEKELVVDEVAGLALQRLIMFEDAGKLSPVNDSVVGSLRTEPLPTF